MNLHHGDIITEQDSLPLTLRGNTDHATPNQT